MGRAGIEGRDRALGATGGRSRWSAVVLMTCVALVGACGAEDDDRAGASQEVFLEAVSTDGAQPFTGSVAREETALAAPTGAETAGRGIAAVRGGEPGLYGGTLDQGACDPEQLVAYLDAHPDKAGAWARAQGIQPDGIAAFVGTLTSVVLRHDTRVTNHGYANGRATPRQSVLQAGTAVMVDSRGVPRVRCACGNPLGAPHAVNARYSGEPWTGFEGRSLQVVRSAAAALDSLVITDLRTDGRFRRPLGTNGDDDRAVARPPAGDGVVLDMAGLGVTSLGESTDTAAAALEAALGPPVQTTALTPDPAMEQGCNVPVTVARWSNGLSVYYDTTTNELFAYTATWDSENGPPQPGDAPLSTPEGIRLGASEGEVLAAYPGASISSEPDPTDGDYGDAVMQIPLRTALSARVTGGMTIQPDDRTVTSIVQYRLPMRCPFGV